MWFSSYLYFNHASTYLLCHLSFINCIFHLILIYNLHHILIHYCHFLQSIGQSIDYDKLVDKIKAYIMCFKNDNNMQRYHELKNVKTNIHYRIAHGEYETKITAKTLIFEDFRRKHVKAELNKFNRAEKSKQKILRWRWSPLFQVFL